MEEKALRHAIFLQLMHQPYLVVRLENLSCHPTTGTGIPMDWQAGFVIALKCMRVVGVIHHDRLKVAVSSQVSSQQEGETVLECFEACGRLLLPHDVCAFRHLLPLQACFIHVENLLGLVLPLLDDGLEQSGYKAAASSSALLASPERLMLWKPQRILKLIKPACAGDEIGHGAGLLFLQIVEALHRLVLGVIEGLVNALTLPMVHPCDQRHPDHDDGLA